MAGNSGLCAMARDGESYTVAHAALAKGSCPLASAMGSGIELGVVIGSLAKYVPTNEALSHVAL